jgi:hypothetical protein
MMRRTIRAALLSFLALTQAAPSRAIEPTYHRDVARILQEHCQDCHRPGQVAPFPLLSYEQARKRSSDVARVAEDHRMPPWPASTTEGGPFRDARVLRPQEIDTLVAWAEAGCPEGDANDGPKPKSWDSDWALGKPDLVIQMPEPYTLGADGRDEFRVFVIPTGLTEGKWVAAIDFKPGNPKVVHHILSAFDVTGQGRKLDQVDPKPGYKVFGGFGLLPSGGLGGWAPGKRPQALPDGVGRFLPPKADILVQIHYHKSGKVETDATSVALYFSRTPVEKLVRGGAVTPPRDPGSFRPKLVIPAGEARYEIKGSWTVPFDAHATAVAPHMHWIGKDFLLRATRPDGSALTLIKIDDWNFNWQGTYDFTTPPALPKGTRVDLLAHFDNSERNANNQSHPPVDVRWGEQTTDEMCIGFLQLTRDDEHLHNKPPLRYMSIADFDGPEGARRLELLRQLRARAQGETAPARP